MTVCGAEKAEEQGSDRISSEGWILFHSGGAKTRFLRSANMGRVLGWLKRGQANEGVGAKTHF